MQWFSNPLGPCSDPLHDMGLRFCSSSGACAHVYVVQSSASCVPSLMHSPFVFEMESLSAHVVLLIYLDCLSPLCLSSGVMSVSCLCTWIFTVGAGDQSTVPMPTWQALD